MPRVIHESPTKGSPVEKKQISPQRVQRILQKKAMKKKTIIKERKDETI